MKNPDHFYLGLAREASTASRAKRRRVGAMIVKDHNIIAFGFNGTPSGFPNACETPDGKKTLPEVLHAESNAIAKCAKSTQSSEGATLYCTDGPCFDCAKLIIQAGIVRVVYENEYHDLSGLELLTKAGIKHEKCNFDN